MYQSKYSASEYEIKHIYCRPKKEKKIKNYDDKKL